MTDREAEAPPEGLERINGWIEQPPRLLATGPMPPASERRWATNRATTLVEGDPCSTHFVGLLIPGLAAAHTYIEQDPQGKILQTYQAMKIRFSSGCDHWTLTRFQVVDRSLVRFASHCHEESTLDVPFADEPGQQVVLADLNLK